MDILKLKIVYNVFKKSLLLNSTFFIILMMCISLILSCSKSHLENQNTLSNKDKFQFRHHFIEQKLENVAWGQTSLVDVDKAGHWIMLQVHDELDCSVENRAEGEAISEIMSQAITGLVPFAVDTELGPSWGEVK